MNGRRQRLAWAIVLSSLIACVGLVVFVPLGLNAYRQRAMRAMEVEVQANQGTVGIVQNDGESVALFSGDPSFSLGVAGSVLTNATDTALLLAQTEANGPLIARIQVYGSTQVQLDDARTPRFDSSSRKNELALNLRAGRILLSIPDDSVRPVAIQVTTPQGQVHIEEQGQYSVDVSNSESQVTALHGSVVLESGDEQIELGDAQRAIMSSPGMLEGPLTAERNLIANGEFSQGLEMWLPLSPNVEIVDQPSVEVAVDSNDPEPVVIFKRLGIGHADAGLRQVVGQDVTDFESLKLLLSMHVAEQSLGVCGQQGSECPVMVRIEYADVNGVDQIWQQGFYASGEVGPDTPDVCVACPPPLNEHQRVPFDQLAFYESENLLEKLGQFGILPAQIKSITVIASGHSFESRIYDLALIAVE